MTGRVLSGVPVLATRGLTKSFAGNVVVRAVDLEVEAGEIHALVGENGAGKSTLLKLIAGVHQPDAGEILLDGQPVHMASPAVAQARGVALISQEPMLFPDLDVGENIFVGDYPVASSLPWVWWEAVYRRAAELLDSLGVPLEPRGRVRGLSIAQQQLVEIASALSRRARIVLMDEPTAALSPREVARLFDVMRALKERGAAILFVSHRLDEVLAIADWVTVLRDGERVGTYPTGTVTRDDLVRRMVGREPVAFYRRGGAGPGLEVLRVEGLTRAGVFQDVSFTVRRGEIVAMAGLVGSGRSEVARAIFGIDPLDRGEVRIEGRPVAIRSPRDAMAAGLAYLPEDRQQQGLVLPLPVAHNLTLTVLSEVTRLGWLQNRTERALAQQQVERLQVRTESVDKPVEQLSGGNQQKVLVGKYLLTRPKVLILDEPTRGVDVGAKAEIHRLVAELAGQGLGILLISSELPEVLSLADRILVLHEGRLVEELARDEATEERIMMAAVGSAGRSVGDAPGRLSDARREEQPSARTLRPATGSRHAAGDEPRRTASAPGGLIARARHMGILLALLILGAGTSLHSPHFATVANFQRILLDIALLLIVATGETLVILTRNIDLSVGSTLGLTGITVGFYLKGHPGLSVPAIVAMGVGLGMVLGAVNGILVSWGRVPSIIATLGTLTMYRGLVYIQSGSQQVNPQDLPARLVALARPGQLGVSWLVVFALVIAAGAAVFLRYSRTGRAMYATGTNPQAAYLRGLPTERVVGVAFLVSGALAGLAGVLYAARYGTVNPASAGTGLELQAVAAAVIGGTSVLGGLGSIAGTFLGSLLLGTIANALAVSGVSGFWQRAVEGAIILAAVSTDAALRAQPVRRVRAHAAVAG